MSTSLASSPPKMTLAIAAAMMAVFTLIISIVLMSVAAFVQTNNPEAMWRAGWYFIGATSILSAYAYIDGVAADLAVADKKDA